MATGLRPTSSIYCVGAAPFSPCSNSSTLVAIQDAVALAVAGDEIRVANGTYTGSGGSAVVTVNTGISITGGFAGGSGGWNTSTNSTNTIIDGQGARNTLSVSGATVTVQNFTLNNGGISNTGGTVAVQTGYTLNIASAGTINGSFTMATNGFVVFTSGSSTLAGGTAFTGAGMARLINATLTINGSVSAQNFEQTAGILTGSGTFTVSGIFNWLGGTMDSSTSPNVGITTIAGSSAIMHIGGTSATKTLSQRTLNINSDATATVDGTGAGALNLSNSATVNNNGTFTIQNNNDAIQYGGGTAPAFNNAGTFNKVSGTGITTLGNGFIVLTNSGTIVAHSGIISLDSQSNDTGTGIYSATVGATLRFGGNNHTLSPGSHVNISGTIEFSAGTTFVQGTYNVSGNTNMSGGTVVFGGHETIDTLSVHPNSTLTLSGSSSSIDVRVLDWTGGTIIGGSNPNDRGTINVSESILFDGVQSNESLVRCTINNHGTATLNTTGGGIFFMGDGAYFNNDNLPGSPAAVFDIHSNDCVARY